ncbi:MAG: hypothetical protein V4633_09470 [Pseudomonadota bacterium]
MKNMYLRTGVALACAMALNGCGGSDPDIVLRVAQITGLNRTGMTLTNNGGTPVAVGANASSFNFPELVEADSEFKIEIATQPPNAVCQIFNGSGNVGSFTPTSIVITCKIFTYDLFGKVENLKKPMVINNGSVRVTIPAAATSFTLTTFNTALPPVAVSGQIPEDVPYGLTILEQPEGQTCTIINGSGVMPKAGIPLATTPIVIRCV